MFCKYCGKELSDQAAFCSQCGKPVTRAKGTTAQEEANHQEDTASQKERYAQQNPFQEEPKKQRRASFELSRKIGRLLSKLMPTLLSKGAEDLLGAAMVGAFLLWGALWLLMRLGALGLLLLMALGIWIWVEISSGREDYQDRCRSGEILDEENIAYTVWKELLETEAVPSAEMKGFLNPEALKASEYPVKSVSAEALQKSLSQYYFELDFRQGLKLGKLYTGKEVFWILPVFQILTLLFCPLGVAVLEILTTVAVYGLLYYGAVYYPGMIHMARTPHFLPVSMTEEAARDRICAALQRETSVEMAESGQILVDGKYPLNVEAGTFHIDFPEDIGQNHRNLHLKKLAQWNAAAARVLFPERVQQPILPVVEGRTRYKIGETFSHIGCVLVGCALLVYLAGGLEMFRTPADSIQDTYWEQYSETEPLGEAFERNYKRTSWENRTIGEDAYVLFSGVIRTSISNLNVEILYEYDDESGMFYVDSASVNDIEVSNLTAAALMQYGYDGDEELLLQSILAESILDAIFS